MTRFLPRILMVTGALMMGWALGVMTEKAMARASFSERCVAAVEAAAPDIAAALVRMGVTASRPDEVTP